jgi:hypothetical protein
MLHGVTRPSFTAGNFLLSVLPRDELKFIQPHLESISLPAGHVYAEFCDPLHQCFFPNNGVITLLSVTYSGHACEVGYIGFEGMVGLPVIFGKNEMPYLTLVPAKSEGFLAPCK